MPWLGRALDQLIFRARNAGHAIGKVLAVGAADVGDDSPIGTGNARERGDFAGMRHAHLDHRDLMLGLELQQLQRQSKGIVQIPFGFKYREARAQNLGDRLLRGGLACTAGDGDDAFVPMPPHRGRERLQRFERIVHEQ